MIPSPDTLTALAAGGPGLALTLIALLLAGGMVRGFLSLHREALVELRGIRSELGSQTASLAVLVDRRPELGAARRVDLAPTPSGLRVVPPSSATS